MSAQNPSYSETQNSKTTEADQLDLVEKSLRANGCWETHLNLSECVANRRDWRACQVEVKALQDCMKKANERKRNLKE